VVWATFVAFLAITIIALWVKDPSFKNYVENISPMFYYFLGAGFVFALIDGAIGMSYGVTSTTFSLSMGIPPASASMGVHLSEIMSNGIAGWMHYRMGNVNWKLFKLLLIARYYRRGNRCVPAIVFRTLRAIYQTVSIGYTPYIGFVIFKKFRP
jgi:hypothetical protein